MTGIYIHIPFCRQACRYCDFYFTINLKMIDGFMAALEDEILSRAAELPHKNISTIYLGGGTPSVLSIAQLTKIIKLLRRSFRVDGDAEITIEANPDDMNPEYLMKLREVGFNRISIGVQSFYEEDLEIMRRSHNAIQAKKAVGDAFDAGFRNITMDLIYGTPGLTSKRWKENLKMAFQLPVQHLSAYHLTFEPGTIFDHWRKQGKIVPVSEETSLEQYEILRKEADGNGLTHYEISNFARDESYSRHNMIYWNRNNYLGFGPSAHSYDGSERRWNLSNLKKYISATGTGESCFEIEKLGDRERYHDYILTSLRTRRGLDKGILKNAFGEEIANHFIKTSEPYIRSGKLVSDDNFIMMTPESWFISDHIMRELFLA